MDVPDVLNAHLWYFNVKNKNRVPNISTYCRKQGRIRYHIKLNGCHLDGVQGGNGSLHVDVGLAGLEAYPVLAVGLQASDPEWCVPRYMFYTKIFKNTCQIYLEP
jgi:hypothetical protein